MSEGARTGLSREAQRSKKAGRGVLRSAALCVSRHETFFLPLRRHVLEGLGPPESAQELVFLFR